MFDLPVRLLTSHPKIGQDTLTLSRGPIIYVAESVDNQAVAKRFPHFEGLGIRSDAKVEEHVDDVRGIPIVSLRSHVLFLDNWDTEELWVEGRQRTWSEVDQPLIFVPWFARANRGGSGQVRTSFPRVY